MNYKYRGARNGKKNNNSGIPGSESWNSIFSTMSHSGDNERLEKEFKRRRYKEPSYSLAFAWGNRGKEKYTRSWSRSNYRNKY